MTAGAVRLAARGRLTTRVLRGKGGNDADVEQDPERQ